MKEIIAISVFLGMFIIVIAVGTNIELDLSFMQNDKENKYIICSDEQINDEVINDACSSTSKFENLLENNTENGKILSSNPEQTEKIIEQSNDTKIPSSDVGVENKDYSLPNFKIPEYPNANSQDDENIKEPIVYYSDGADFPANTIPTLENLKMYTNLYIYDFYIGDITTDSSRVFLDTSMYNQELLQMQSVDLEVLTPKGNLIEYSIDLNTVLNVNDFDHTEPIIEIDSNNIELTKKEFNEFSEASIKKKLADEYGFFVMDDYDGDITNSPQVTLSKAEYKLYNHKYEIIIEAFDSNYNYTESILNVEIVENTDLNAPTISGNNSMEIYNNENIDLLDFTTLGINAYDIEDGDLTQNIYVVDDGNFNNLVNGKYTITYAVADKSGKISNYYFYEINIGSSISTCSDLQNINVDLSSTYILNNDIDCDGIDFKPIGNQFNSFKGVLDGNGYQISNLTITADYGGLFASNSGVIKNLSLTDVNISATTVAGGITAFNTGDVINSSVNGNVTGTTQIAIVGGLVGSNTGNISSCFTDVKLVGYSKIGGIAGTSEYANMNNVYSLMSVNPIDETENISKSIVGGLVGESVYSKYKNAYAISNIEDNYYDIVGGVLGSGSNDVITNTYVNIDVESNGRVGYTVGLNDNVELINNYISSTSIVNEKNKILVTNDAIKRTLINEEFYDVLWTESIDQGFWTLTDTGLPYLNYMGDNNLGTSKILGYQESPNRSEPVYVDPTKVPYIIGPNRITVEYKDIIDLNDIDKIGLEAFDVENNPLNNEITLSETDGFSTNILSEYQVTYTVVDDYNRESEPFVVTFVVEDNVLPVIEGANHVQVETNMLSNYESFSKNQLKASDNGYDISNNIELYDSGGITLDDPKPGIYNVSYVAYDQVNMSEPFIVQVEIVKPKYEIKSCTDLESIGRGANYPETSHIGVDWPINGDYILANDIDCMVNSTKIVNNFDTILKLDGAVIDGNNHRVKNLKIDTLENAYMINEVANSEIKNIIFEDINLISENNSAALIGETNGVVTLSNIQFFGSISGVNYTSALVSRVNLDSKLVLVDSVIDTNISGIKNTGIFVGNLIGSIDTRKNIVNSQFTQKYIYTYELIGKFDKNISVDDMSKYLYQISEKNIINISTQVST